MNDDVAICNVTKILFLTVIKYRNIVSRRFLGVHLISSIICFVYAAFSIFSLFGTLYGAIQYVSALLVAHSSFLANLSSRTFRLDVSREICSSIGFNKLSSFSVGPADRSWDSGSFRVGVKIGFWEINSVSPLHVEIIYL